MTRWVVGTSRRVGALGNRCDAMDTSPPRTLVGSFGFFTAIALSPNLPRYTALAGPSWICRRFPANSALGTARLTSPDPQQSLKHAVHVSSTAIASDPSILPGGGIVKYRRCRGCVAALRVGVCARRRGNVASAFWSSQAPLALVTGRFSSGLCEIDEVGGKVVGGGAHRPQRTHRRPRFEQTAFDTRRPPYRPIRPTRAHPTRRASSPRHQRRKEPETKNQQQPRPIDV